MLLICSITLIVIAEDETRGAESDSPRGAVDAQKKRKKSSKDWNKVDFNDLEKQWEEGDEDAEREMEFEHSEKIMKRKHREARERRLKEEEKKKKKKKREGSATKKEAFKSKSKKSGEPKKKPTFKDDKGEWIPPPPGMEDLDLSQAIGPGGKAGGQMPPGLEGFNMNDMEAGGGLNTEKDMGPQMWFIEITMLQMQGSEKGKRWTRKALDKMAALWAEMLKTAHLSANMYVLGEYKNDPETKEETGPTLLVSLDKAWQQKEITRFIATKPEVLKLTKDRRTLTAANFADDDEDDDEL
jgi:hypothetical protein